MSSPAARLDPDFSREVLDDLFAYRRKRRRVAWLLWVTLGWLGGHRFYLGRHFSAVFMLFTGGGFLLLWFADAFFLDGMVRSWNERQAERERVGLPPIGMDVMPALDEAGHATEPRWAEAWLERPPWRRRVRFAGDLLVIFVAGTLLGSMVGSPGGVEAVVAVLLIAAATALGAGPAWLDDLPGARSLVRWSHRLRLFYHHNAPGSPPVLLLRPVLGILWAPFREKDRMEVRLYVELGAVFTAFFVLLDVLPAVVWPLLTGGDPAVGALLGEWVGEAFMTFFLVYAFAAPIGAVLTLYLLVRRTHRVPRALAAFTAVTVFVGAIAG